MINLKKNFEKRLVSIFIYSIALFLICAMILIIMPKNIQYNLHGGEEIKLPDGISYIRSRSSSRISPSVDFKIGNIQYYSICSYLTDDKSQLCHKDYESVEFVGRDVFFLEVEKFSKNGHQYIGGVILKGEFHSKEVDINLNTNIRLVEKSILFRKYFDFFIKFSLFFSLVLIFMILFFWLNKNSKANKV